MLMRADAEIIFMKMAELVSQRSTCLRRKEGAVLVTDDNRVISTGYNGAPRKLEHCEKVGCLREKLKIPSGQRHELCRAAHAEINAIVSAAVMGVGIRDATIYITSFPCVFCAKAIINGAIKRVVYENDYNDDLSKQLLKESGVEVIKFSDFLNTKINTITKEEDLQQYNELVKKR